MAKLDAELLEAALIGYQQERDRIAARIRELRRQINGEPAVAEQSSTNTTRTRRGISAAARKRISAAQRKRWDAYHAKHANRAKAGTRAKAARKGRLSPEGRQRIIEALKKRWASAKRQTLGATG